MNDVGATRPKMIKIKLNEYWFRSRHMCVVYVYSVWHLMEFLDVFGHKLSIFFYVFPRIKT